VKIMKGRSTVSPLTTVALVALGAVVVLSSPVYAGGATRIGGIGYFADPGAGECIDDAEGNGSDFALRMTGDLEGCHYVFVAEAECTSSGAYRETGTEIFVGEYNGHPGTFGTTYLFTAKLGDCRDLATEIFGRCQHPIVRGSGTGVFEGVTGRFDIKDDIEAGNFPYKGHLRW
jgi:hypothetical protein